MTVHVTTPTIETPEWMDPQYDYTVRWNPLTQQWDVVPF